MTKPRPWTEGKYRGRPNPTIVGEGGIRHKRCFHCGETKTEDGFYAIDGKPVGKCKTCLGVGIRRRPPAMNAAERREWARAYNRTNRAKLAAGQRARRQADPLQVIVECERQRARQAAAPGAGVTRDQWAEALKLAGGRCGYCARPAKLSMEHMDPLHLRGAHEIENVVPSCHRCNVRKGRRGVLQWLVKEAA